MLPSKYRPHTSLRQAMPRPRLVRQCIEGTSGAAALTIIVAPAGFGKTTALGEVREALEREGFRTAWLNCDEADRDLEVFLGNVSTALSISESSQLPLRSAEAFARFCEEVPGRIALLIDEFEAATCEALDEALEAFARGASENVRIFVATRLLSVHRFVSLELDGVACLINAASLRFTEAEAQAFLSHESADRWPELIAEADGWPFVLQLLRLSAINRGAHAGDRSERQLERAKIADYLAFEVMASLDETLRDFIIETSLLNVVTVADAEALTQRKDGAALIHRLEPLVPIVTLEHEPLAARFHPLFQSYLRSRLESRGRADVAVRHERLARHFAATHRVYEAVQCAAEGGLIDVAVELLEGGGAMRFTLSHGLHEAARVLKLIPPARIERRLKLRLMALASRVGQEGNHDAALELERIDAELQRGRFDDQLDEAAQRDLIAIRPLVALTQIEHVVTRPDWNELSRETAAVRMAMPDEPPLWVISLVLEIQLLLRQGVLARAESLVDDYIAMNDRDSVLRTSTDAWNYRAQYELALGSLSTAAALAARSVASTAHRDVYRQSHADQIAHSILGQACYLQNDVRGAVAHFEAIPSAAPFLLFEVYTSKYVWRACCDVALGHLDTALDRLRTAVEFAQARRLPHLALLARAVRACLFATHAAERAYTAAAAEWDEQFDRDRCETSIGEMLDSDAHPWLTRKWLARARVCGLIERHYVLDAVSVANEFAESCAASGRPLIKAEAALIRGRASLANGDAEQARAAVRRALQLTDGTGASRIFLDHGAEIFALVRECAQSLESPAAWARQIVTPTTALDLLTFRQRAVLDELCRGLSSKEIARSLRLSPETVKWHLKAIFERLEVSTREQAVTVARELASGQRNGVSGGHRA